MLSGAAAAHANPIPDTGSGSGGTSVTLPLPEAGPAVLADLSAGDVHTLGLSSDGVVYAWGSNGSGQLGNGSSANSSTPIMSQVPTGCTFAAVSAGNHHSLALGSDGVPYSWGYNNEGQLGDGTRTNSSSPLAVSAPPGVSFTALAAGGVHSLGLTADGVVYAWGSNGSGQLGDGTNITSSVPVVVQAPPGVRFTAIAAGDYHSLGLGSDGVLYAWGYNNAGQLGVGSTTNSNIPVAVPAPPGTTYTEFAAGAGHTVALGSDGALYSWGSNGSGQLGDGTNTASSVPVAVSTPPGIAFVSVTAGDYHSAGSSAQGTLFTWGSNGSGQLGVGTNANSNAPVEVEALSGTAVTAITAGNAHSAVVDANGVAHSWGSNGSGQLGTGTTAASNVPVAVSGPVRAVHVDRVLFGGVAGTELVSGADTLTVLTPASGSCVVDVVVEWSADGIPQTPVAYPNGFTYTQLPEVARPDDQRTAPGETAVFSTAVTGCTPADEVFWETSADGETWARVAEGTDAAVSPDGTTLTLSNVARSADGRQYRAAAGNIEGVGRSEPAILSVAEASTPPEPPESPESPGDDPAEPGANDPGAAEPGANEPGGGGTPELASTGAALPAGIAGLSLVGAVGGALLWAMGRRRSRA